MAYRVDIWGRQHPGPVNCEIRKFADMEPSANPTCGRCVTGPCPFYSIRIEEKK